MTNPLHVAAAVVADGAGRILIARRPDHLHQGGLWEFPGGKVEPGETAHAALVRELHEEVGIDVQDARPLIGIPHDYPDRNVYLDVWRVTRFRGEAQGREGQAILWIPPDELASYRFPAANLPIIAAARLPPICLITPEPGTEPHWPRFIERLGERAREIPLVQLRAHGLDGGRYARLAGEVITVCHDVGARVLLNADPRLVLELGADGVHLSGVRLRKTESRPLPKDLWVGASCHGADDLSHAVRVGADFALLSPVKPTLSHCDAKPLGWPRFRAMAHPCPLPLYALGGLSEADLEEAWDNGAQGIAAIRSLWDRPSTP